MKAKITSMILLSTILSLLLPPAAYTADKSNADDQIELEVTVYNANLGLVKDTRTVDLEKGEGEVRFMDVAAHIMPPTVHVKSLDGPEDFRILEQNYEYDLMNANKLLDKYVGKKVKLMDKNKYQDRTEIVEATLLSNNQGQIFQIDDEIYLGHPGVRILPEIPENLIAQPTLMWLYATQKSGHQKIEVSYLTNNINWKADYVVVLNPNDTECDLSGWVTLNNTSGTEYKNTTLKLVAGDVNRVIDRHMRRRDVGYAAKSVMAEEAGFQEESFFEYHLYDLQRKTTIKNNQTKQIRLIEAFDVGCWKEFRVFGNTYWFTQQYHSNDYKVPVNVYVLFENSQENNLGMPLPGGIMRLYKKDSKGAQQFIGEDRIEHTPKKEKVKLKIGEAFDVVAERRQTDYKRITTRLHESEWEIKLRNRKEEPITVKLVEPLHGNWQVIQNSHSYTKKDAFTIEFDIPVQPDEEVKVTYRVQVGLK